MAEEKSKSYQTPKRILYIVIGLFLLAYVGYQIYRMNFTPVTTETAMQQTIYNNINANVFVIRDEDVVSGQSANGVLVNSVTDGQRVSAGNAIAYLFASETDAENYAKSIEIDKKLTYYKELQSHKSIYTVDPDTVDRAIENTLNNIQDIKASGKLEGIDNAKQDLIDNMNQRQLITNTLTDEDLTSKIQELTAQKAGVPTYNYKEISAPEPGAFVSKADGYENTADYSKINELTTADIERYISAPPADTSATIGKLIKEFDWYMACAVDTLSITDLKVGKNVVVSFPFSSVGEVTASVTRMTSEAGGKSVLILKCNLMSDEISSLRSESAQIRLNTHSGLRVSTKAIRINENGEKGVYVLTGNAIEFKKIKVVYTGTDFVLCEITGGKGDLELYDEVVITGKDLYDGKIAK